MDARVIGLALIVLSAAAGMLMKSWSIELPSFNGIPFLQWQQNQSRFPCHIEGNGSMKGSLILESAEVNLPTKQSLGGINASGNATIHGSLRFNGTMLSGMADRISGCVDAPVKAGISANISSLHGKGHGSISFSGNISASARDKSFISNKVEIRGFSGEAAFKDGSFLLDGRCAYLKIYGNDEVIFKAR